MTKLKIISIGNSAGVILPKELLEKLRVSKDDILTVTDSANGLNFSAYDNQVDGQMDIANRIMRENRNLLKKLAE